MSLRCLLGMLLVTALAGVTRSSPGAAPDPSRTRTETNLLYRTTRPLTHSMEERCRVDLEVPTKTNGFATVVWFHGGGLTSGDRAIPDGLRGRGFAVVAAGYRLSPRDPSPAYLEDAAAAVAWTFRNIERYGGSPRRIFLSGHSAGGYLAAMVALDKRWLAPHGLDPNALAGVVPYSGQCITHFTIRGEHGIKPRQPTIDDLAPLFHVRSDAPPMLLITGDRERELYGRYEENAYLWRMMKEVGHTNTVLHELQGFDHGQMPEPAHPLLVRFIRSH